MTVAFVAFLSLCRYCDRLSLLSLCVASPTGRGDKSDRTPGDTWADANGLLRATREGLTCR